MSVDRPHVIVLGGPNGAGKSTAAADLLRGALAVDEFVNADTVAAGLSAFDPDRAALQAGRVMLARLRELAGKRRDFAFEITLASRTFAPWIGELTDSGYTFHLVFLWLSSPDLAVARVAERVRSGGHRVPEEVVRRRYCAGLANFFGLYRPLAATWRFYDNSLPPRPRLVATGSTPGGETVLDPAAWARVLAEAERA
jgi:predicted ABC-type ATPase